MDTQLFSFNPGPKTISVNRIYLSGNSPGAQALTVKIFLSWVEITVGTPVALEFKWDVFGFFNDTHFLSNAIEVKPNMYIKIQIDGEGTIDPPAFQGRFV